MEPLTETVAERELTQYEIERNKPMPSLNHAIIQKNLLVSLDYRYRKQYTILSEVSLVMPQKPDAVPDVAIYPKLEIDYLDDKVAMEQMPITTIEILSPSQSDSELVAKAHRYFEAGVKSCWIVLPVFKIVVLFSSPTDKKIFTEDMSLVDGTTGIELSLAEVFAD